jgi:hypothetical protein
MKDNFAKKAKRNHLQSRRLQRCREVANLAELKWGTLPLDVLRHLEELTTRYGLSLAAGDLQLLEGRWYVTHTGLLRISNRRRCAGITTFVERRLSDSRSNRWVFKAIVYKVRGTSGFVGYGDADPSNVSPLVRGAEMRVAETRAVNRALRKAYGIGLCSIEELGWSPRSDSQPREATATSNGNGNGANGNYHQPRLRDRLCLLIRHHRLNPALVKSYAADYCGTAALREASRERLEAFIAELSDRATKDRDALLCHLNSYSEPKEVQS